MFFSLFLTSQDKGEVWSARTGHSTLYNGRKGYLEVMLSMWEIPYPGNVKVL